MEIIIKPARLDDLNKVQRLFVDTILAICKDDYSPQQLKVWTSSIENKNRWEERMKTQFFLIAKWGALIVGYASLEDKDYLDHLYVHKDHQRKGIAENLCAEIEKEAIRRGANHLYADVSKTALPFFEKRGFKMIRSQVKKNQWG